MATFHRDQFRGDYEIHDEAGKCRGFIWRHEGQWVCRIDEDPAQYPDSFKASKLLAEQMLAGSSGRAV